MIKDINALVGKKFIGNVNNEVFEVVGIENDNGTKYVVLEDSKKRKHSMAMCRFECMLLTEIR